MRNLKQETKTKLAQRFTSWAVRDYRDGLHEQAWFHACEAIQALENVSLFCAVGSGHAQLPIVLCALQDAIKRR